MEKRKYYSYRTQASSVGFSEVVRKFKTVYRILVQKDYFKELGGITESGISETIRNEASLRLPFQPFPIELWEHDNVTIENVFDTIEFFFDFVSQPYGWESKQTSNSWRYEDYEGYNREDGRNVYREYINMLLNDFGDGFELTAKGEVVTIGKDGSDLLFSAPIVEFDFENIDRIVQRSIEKWRRRTMSMDERKAVIKDLADVFEWLKKSKELEKVLDKKDDKLIFDIVNGFEIRHHNPDQKGNYDRSIWYSWMFHFYLATYHAVTRMIAKERQRKA